MLQITTAVDFTGCFCELMRLKRTPEGPNINTDQSSAGSWQGTGDRLSSFPLPLSVALLSLRLWLIIKVCVAGTNGKALKVKLLKFAIKRAPVKLEGILFYMHHWKEMKVSRVQLRICRHFVLCYAISNSVARILSCLTKHDFAPHSPHLHHCLHASGSAQQQLVCVAHPLWVSLKSHLLWLIYFC